MTEGTILVVPKAIGNGRVDLELCMSEVCWVVVTSWKGKRRGLWLGHLVVGRTPNPMGNMGGQADVG